MGTVARDQGLTPTTPMIEEAPNLTLMIPIAARDPTLTPMIPTVARDQGLTPTTPIIEEAPNLTPMTPTLQKKVLDMIPIQEKGLGMIQMVAKFQDMFPMMIQPLPEGPKEVAKMTLILTRMT